jgi:hypothetical protein
MCGGAVAAGAWMTGRVSLLSIAMCGLLLSSGYRNVMDSVDITKEPSERICKGFVGAAQLVSAVLVV